MELKVRVKLPLSSILALGVLALATFSYYNLDVWGEIFGMGMFVSVGWLAGRDIRSMGFNRTGIVVPESPRAAIIDIFLGLASAALAYGAYFLFHTYVYVSEPDWGLRLSTAGIILVAATALCEEIFFRGYLQIRLMENLGAFSAITCVSLSVAIYKSLIHIEKVNLKALAEISIISFSGSMWVGYLLMRRGNILAPVVCHVLWDLMVYSSSKTIPSWLF